MIRHALALAALTLACQRAGAPRDAGRDTCACHRHDAAPLAALAPLPGASVWQLDAQWTTQSGENLTLSSLRGHPTLVLLFYGTCRAACPVLVRDLARLDASLSPEARARTRVLLVTFDPARDTPERRRELAAEHHLDLARWTLLGGAEHDTRALAALLGVQFTRTGPDTFDHSNVITLLDADGVVRHQLEGLSQPTEAMAAAVEELVH